MAVLNDKSRLIVSAVGIFVSYSIFGVLQEKITRGRYGDEVNDDGTTGERFTFTLALVGVQCFFNYLFAKGKYPSIVPALSPRHPTKSHRQSCIFSHPYSEPAAERCHALGILCKCCLDISTSDGQQ